jgi:hypothetical protein
MLILPDPELAALRETERVEAERLDAVREKNLEIVRESLDLVRESLAAESKTDVQQAEADVQTDAPPDIEQTVPTPPVDTFELIESDPPPPVVTTAMPDEISIPPVGDLAHEPVADQFFSEGEILAAGVARVEEDETWDTPADKGQRKSLPHVVERRARFAKYVRWAVAGAAVVCLAALARTAIMPSGAGKATAFAAVNTLEAPESKAATTEVAPVAAPQAPAVEPAAPAAAVVDTAKVDVPKADLKAEPEKAEKAEAPAATVAATAEAPKAEPAPSDKTALQEKNDTRRALERGKAQDAIDAGERSVALDPTDGEAWLLLGAAYQDKGKMTEARRCYASCIKEGKRGPLSECRAMLR